MGPLPCRAALLLLLVIAAGTLGPVADGMPPTADGVLRTAHGMLRTADGAGPASEGAAPTVSSPGLSAAEPGSTATGSTTSIFVVTHAWHTGIAIRTADLPGGRWPAADVFAGAEYVEVGWGDRDFWMAQRETIGLALKAALASQASVLRILWFEGPVDRALPWSDVVALSVSRPGLTALVDFVAESYALSPSGQPIDLGPAGGPGSRFYLATGRYHLLNTSNRWTAQALIRAGLSFSGSSLTAGSIMCQAAAQGRVIRLRERCAGSPPAREGP